LTLQLGERVTLNTDPRERPALQLNDRHVAVTRQNLCPLVHLGMIAAHQGQRGA
jgi:hypothetical protein